MSGDEYGVVTRTVTRGQMIQALQQLPVAEEPPQPEAPVPARRRRPALRRTPPVAPPAPVPHKVTCPLAEADVADLLLAHFPELEPASLKAVKQAEAIIAERDEEITGLRQEAATAEALIETLRAELVEAGVASGRLRAQGQRQAVTIGDLRRENAELRAALASPPTAEPILDLAYLEDLTARAAAMKGALERFAAPGAITATDRRKAACDALGAAQGADGEAAP